jgi:biopolymer transport protein ExbD
LATWDVFHGDRLEVERSLTLEAVRQALARGDLRDDDLIRPAGTTVAWVRLADFPALLVPDPAPEAEAESGSEASLTPPPTFAEDDPAPPEFADLDDDEDEDDRVFAATADDGEEFGADDLDLTDDASQVALPVAQDEPPAVGDEGFGLEDLEILEDDSLVALPVGGTAWDEEAEEFDPQEEDEAIAEFTLARGSAERVEELDLAAMVDVAFQLVLFFLVTATTVLYKSLEVPKPNPDSPAAAAAQGRSRSLDDLKDDYILVEIDPAGSMKIDREPVAADMAGLIARLRDAREKTGRKAMLLSADFATPHRNAVLAYDAANEIGLGIAIARPTGSEPAANPPPAAKKPARG